jgi:predicted HTH domain antitoxin
VTRKHSRAAFVLLQYNDSVVRLQIELDVAEEVVDRRQLEEHLRKEAILALFAEHRITAGQASRGLGLGRLEFMEALKQRGIPYVTYTAQDWEADGRAIAEFGHRRESR